MGEGDRRKVSTRGMAGESVGGGVVEGWGVG